MEKKLPSIAKNEVFLDRYKKFKNEWLTFLAENEVDIKPKS